jgi:glucosylceramidase
MFGWGRSLILCLMMSAIGGALVCAPAQAGVVTEAQYASLHRPGLSLADDQAITIRSVTATSDPSLGLIVTVNFAGDIERYLGQGGLKNGLIALILEPGVVTQKPAGLVEQGGGFTPGEFSMLVKKRGRETVKRATVDLFSPEHVLHTFSGSQYGVIRDGDQVVFRLAGPVLADIAGVKVKMFAKSPLRASNGTPALTTAGWRAVVNERPASVASLSINPSLLSNAQLAAAGSSVATLESGAVQPELRSEQKVRTQLKTALENYVTVQELARAHHLPLLSTGALVSDLGSTGARIGRLHNELAALQGLSANIATLSTAGVQVTQTDNGLSQYLSAQPGRPLSTLQPQGLPVIDVNPQLRYQQFTGVGAAMTDSSAWLIYDELSPSSRLALLQALFGAPGTQNSLNLPAIHLNFLRVGIGAPGAMTVGAPYSYDDNPPTQNGTDPTLKYFSIAHDLSYIIPTLQQALSINPGLEILANPWSPPAWMKSEDTLDNPDGQNTLLTADYGTFANYIVKFIQAYQSEGVPITAIAPENEPSSGQVATDYPGMTFPESDEAQFITQNLAPALQAAGLNTKIYGNDLSWDSASYASALASSPAASDLSGISWHCYFGSPTAMSQQHQATPGLDQLVDECSPEIRGFGTPEFLISSLRNWASAVSVWSVALDPNGEPVQPGNDCGGCLGPVTINEQTGTITPRTEYYQLGQVSDFVQPGATRVDSPSFVTYGLNSSDVETVSSGLDDVAFQNPDGSMTLVAYNNSSSPITFAVDSGGHYFTYALPGFAMTTFVWP